MGMDPQDERRFKALCERLKAKVEKRAGAGPGRVKVELVVILENGRVSTDSHVLAAESLRDAVDGA